MTDSNPYRAPTESGSRAPNDAVRRGPSAAFAFAGVLLIVFGLMLDTTTFVPPRPTSVNMLEIAVFVVGVGLLIAAYRARRR